MTDKNSKILMIAPEPFMESRGTPFSVYHRCKALASEGFEIELFTYHVGEDTDLKNVRVNRIPNVPFVEEVPIGPSLVKILLDAILFLKVLKFTIFSRNDLDYVHAHEESVIFAYFLKKVFEITLIYDMHSSMPQQLKNFDFSQSEELTKIFSYLEALVIKNSDLVIAICQHLKEIVKDVDSDANVHVIENVPLEPEKDADFNEEELKEELGIDEEKVVLYTGTFEHYQGIDTVIKSIPILLEEEKNVLFILVGGEESQVEKMKDLAKSLDVEDFIIFTGIRPSEEMPVYMSIADVLLSPRRIGTNVPLKIYSYLKSGTPMVATKMKAHTQVLDKDTAVLVENNPEGIAEGILKLLKNDSLRKKIGRNGKNLAENEYSYDAFRRKTINAYNSLNF